MISVINSYRHQNAMDLSFLLQDLIHYYPLTADSDDVIGGEDGAGTSVSYSDDGDFQNTLNLTASTSSNVTFSDVDSFSLLADFTISLRFRVNSLNNGFLISKRNATTDKEFQLSLFGSGTTIRFRMFDQSNGATRDIVSSLGAVVGTWYMITVTYISGQLKLYKDGVDTLASNQDTGSFTALENGNADLILGKYSADTSFSLDGSIGEVAIWERGLSANEIDVIKNRYTSNLSLLNGVDIPDPVNNNFIIVVKSDNAGTSSSNQFTIPTTGSGYDYSISTSDGYSASGITGSHTITFPTGAGEHTVTISGDFPRLYFNNGGDKLKLISIENWGNYGLGSTNQDRAFRGCENVVNNTSDEPHFSLVTSFAFTFQNCNNLVIPPVADYSAGENFSYCWFGCDIVSFPSIDISAGTNFSDAFRNNLNLTDLPANMFDSCLGTNFTRAFLGTNLSQTSIDNILVSLDTANQSGGTFEQNNGSAPSSVGETAIDNLRSRGWTVIVTGGY